MIIAPSLGIIFIHIHKTGGTSIEALLEPFLRWNDLQLGSSILGTAMNRPYKARFGLTKHSSLKEIALVCGDENAKKGFIVLLSFASPLHAFAPCTTLLPVRFRYLLTQTSSASKT